MNKLFIFFTLSSLSVIVLTVIFKFECMSPTKRALENFITFSFDIWNKDDLNQPKKEKIFSRNELLQFKGKDGGKIYLAIVGHVYDVTRGKRHYGPGGGYEFFAGIDGSKGYVTGEFNEEGLIDDISELTPPQISSLENWRLFYEKDYKYVGVVEGSFYDKDGEELPMMKVYKNKLKTAKREEKLQKLDEKLFPGCNSEWSQDKGSRVWCSNMSGGIKRDWVGVPRLYYKAGGSKSRCACVRTSGPPSAEPHKRDHDDRGDLDNPNLQLYPNCEAHSESCKTS